MNARLICALVCLSVFLSGLGWAETLVSVDAKAKLINVDTGMGLKAYRLKDPLEVQPTYPDSSDGGADGEILIWDRPLLTERYYIGADTADARSALLEPLRHLVLHEVVQIADRRHSRTLVDRLLDLRRHRHVFEDEARHLDPVLRADHAPNRACSYRRRQSTGADVYGSRADDG